MKEGLGNCEALGFGSMVESINKIYVSFFRVNLLITESTPFALFLDQWTQLLACEWKQYMWFNSIQSKFSRLHKDKRLTDTILSDFLWLNDIYMKFD